MEIKEEFMFRPSETLAQLGIQYADIYVATAICQASEREGRIITRSPYSHSSVHLWDGEGP